MSTFAVDFDDTITADPVLMLGFIQQAAKRGHRVVVATQRSNIYEDEIREVVGAEVEIAFCAGHAKEAALLSLGISVGVWIDDFPAAVYSARAYRGHACVPTLSPAAAPA